MIIHKILLEITLIGRDSRKYMLHFNHFREKGILVKCNDIQYLLQRHISCQKIPNT